MGHCHSRPRCHSNYSYYSRGCEPCHPCEPPRMMQHSGCQPCHCHSPQIIMYDSGRGYGRKNVQQMCQCGGFIPENRIPQQPYYPQTAPIPTTPSMPPYKTLTLKIFLTNLSVLYPPGPVNPGSYIQPQQTPYPSSQQQQIPIPITNNYPQTQQISKPQQPQIPINNPYQHSKPQSSSQQPRSSSPPPPYS